MKIYNTLKSLVLGSGSPRREELLSSIGLKFKIDPATCDEPPARAGQLPEDYAIEMALMKARNVAASNPQTIVIGADTIVACDMNILGKPSDKTNAIETLKSLCGRSHKVITGCAIISENGEETSYAVTTEVEFINCDEAAIKAYVATGEPDDKAGSYAIQGQGAFLVKGICGSYTNVVGLPLARIMESLISIGAVSPVISE
ncbi:septum formation protein [Maridesulfovibrio ferrireducens]|uniref:dTTP/UTP pyrophosphatase n=1 Tax=Maridesulfovibrio ferrireducens TaxID=246191 RepID=A0A1G9HFV4_9BACT|nr:Maf family protein [Maridesulfovibrio ferrireducens]SDL11911.1 septum formation protein [Maridesulfovibrio ferrireducens]